MFPLEVSGETYQEETRVMRLSSTEDRKIVARVILTEYQRVTVRRTGVL